MIYAGDSYFSIDWWTDMLTVFSLNLLPFGILLFFNLIKEDCHKKDIAILVSTIIVCGFGIVILIDAFFIHIDAQSGLIFLFLPIIQSIVAIIGGMVGIALYVSWYGRD
jgi:hypothetical protein